MYSRIVVPVDCSDMAWTAIGPAHHLAQKWGADLELISVVHYGWEVEHATADIEQYLAACGLQEDTIVTVFETQAKQPADELADHLEKHPGSLVVMTSHGRGRSAALLGSVAERLLHLVPDPILVFGPSVDGDHAGLEGRLLVCVDGTETSELALDLAAPWAKDFDMEPWVVAVAKEVPAAVGGEPVVESAYPHRMADRLGKAVGREVEFEALHGKDPAKSVASFAETYEGGLIIAATHGRTGLDRFRGGSVAMDIVHHAPCPVLLIMAPEGTET